MNYKITKVSPETISKIKLNYVVNFEGQITQRHINKMVQDYVNQLQKQGYTNEQIEAMNIQFFYTQTEN